MLLNGFDVSGGSVNEVTDVPDNFKKWVENNADRINRAKNLPYFLQDNPKYLTEPAKLLRKIKVGNTSYVVKDLMSQCEVVDTANGKVYLHHQHGKREKAENLRIAKWRAENHGEEVILLPNPDRFKSADTFNITRSVFEEYKVNSTASINAIDRTIRAAAKQADHILIEINSDISHDDLSRAIYSRVARTEGIKELRLKVGDSEAVYSRKQILSSTFKIKPEDFHNVKISRGEIGWGANPRKRDST